MSKKRQKKVILSAGGTGGHLFPAQSVAMQLSQSCEILFVAGGLGANPYFNRDSFQYQEIDCATFSVKNPFKILHGGIKIAKGVYQAKKIIDHFSPDVIVGFGSFFTLPLLIASKMINIPIILHEQNAVPGKVNKLFSKYAMATAITFPESAKYLKGNKVQVNFPIRIHPQAEITHDRWKYFGLSSEKLTLLLFGGSQGAKALNKLFLQALPIIHPKLPPFQILHFTGKNGDVLEAESYYRSLGIHHCVKQFESRMDFALSVADIALTRGGASTIAELIESETPAVLIPFPYATENHQMKNAEHFVRRVKGGEMLLEETATPELLANTLQELLHSRIYKKENISAFKKMNHLSELSELILNL